MRSVWDHPEHALAPHRPLAAYGPDYRLMVQACLWAALRRRRSAAAMEIGRLGIGLLPRWRDRLFAATPPSITELVAHSVSSFTHASRTLPVYVHLKGWAVWL
jgi:hypothetical protein